MPPDLHFYPLSPAGLPTDVDDLTAQLELPDREIGPLEVALQRAGPNHFVVYGFDVPIAAVRVFTPRPTPRAAPGMLDPQVAVLEMASGALVDIEMFATCTYGYDVRCEVVGSEGAVALEGPRANRLELQAWVDAVLAGTATGPSAWDGYAATLVAACAVDAQRVGTRVPVALADRPALYD